MKAGGISVYRAAVPGARDGPRRRALLLYGMQEWVLPATNKAGRRRPQRDQGPPGAVLRPVRPALDAGERRAASTTSTTSSSASARRARGRRRARPRAASSRSTASRSTTSTRGAGSCASALFASRAAWNAAPRAYDLERGWRRTTGRAPVFQPFAEPARAGDRPRPGRRDRAALLLQARGEALRHDGLRRAARLHRLARGPRLRRGQAAGAAPPQAGLPDGRPRHDAAGGALLVRRRPARRALRHRHRDRDRDRVLGGAGHLRGPRATTRSSTRPSPPGPRTSSSARPAST